MKYDIEIQFPNFRVLELSDLEIAVVLKRAILTKGSILHNHQGYTPAAFVYNLPASVVQRWLISGMYIKKRADEELFNKDNL